MADTSIPAAGIAPIVPVPPPVVPNPAAVVSKVLAPPCREPPPPAVVSKLPPPPIDPRPAVNKLPPMQLPPTPGAPPALAKPLSAPAPARKILPVPAPAIRSKALPAPPPDAHESDPPPPPPTPLVPPIVLPPVEGAVAPPAPVVDATDIVPMEHQFDPREDAELAHGAQYPDKMSFLMACATASLNRRMIQKKNDKTRLIVICPETKVGKCSFRACIRPRDDEYGALAAWVVTDTSNFVHTCPVPVKKARQRSSSFSTKLLASLLKKELKKDIGLKTKDILPILQRVDPAVTKHQAYIARRKAKADVWGDELDGFKNLEGWAENVHASDPDSIVVLDSEELKGVKGVEGRTFKSAFVIPGCSVRMWRAGKLQKFVMAEFATCRSRYKGVLGALCTYMPGKKLLLLGYVYAPTSDLAKAWGGMLARCADVYAGLNAEDCLLSVDGTSDINGAIMRHLPHIKTKRGAHHVLEALKKHGHTRKDKMKLFWKAATTSNKAVLDATLLEMHEKFPAMRGHLRGLVHTNQWARAEMTPTERIACLDRLSQLSDLSLDTLCEQELQLGPVQMLMQIYFKQLQQLRALMAEAEKNLKKPTLTTLVGVSLQKMNEDCESLAVVNNYSNGKATISSQTYGANIRQVDCDARTCGCDAWSPVHACPHLLRAAREKGREPSEVCHPYVSWQAILDGCAAAQPFSVPDSVIKRTALHPPSVKKRGNKRRRSIEETEVAPLQPSALQPPPPVLQRVLPPPAGLPPPPPRAALPPTPALLPALPPALPSSLSTLPSALPPRKRHCHGINQPGGAPSSVVP